MAVVSELYQLHPPDPDEYWSNTSPNLDEAVRCADEALRQPDVLGHLDRLDAEEHGQSIAVRKAILRLPPDVVLEQLGEDVAVWATVKSVLQGENDAMQATLQEKAGYNLADLETARLWMWNRSWSSSARLIQAQYRLMQSMRSNLTEQIDLPALLKANLREGVEVSDKRLADYELKPLSVSHYNTHFMGGRSAEHWGPTTDSTAHFLWVDAPSGMTLTYRGQPHAMSGIGIHGRREQELLITQIQGVRGKHIDPEAPESSSKRFYGSIPSRGLMPFDWQKVMVDAAEQIGTTFDIPTAVIQAGRNNIWTTTIKRDENRPHLEPEVAQKMYDDTASRLGYTANPERGGNWYKSLENTEDVAQAR